MITVIDGTDGHTLGCDCYGGCWGDHSLTWPGLAFSSLDEAEEAWRLCHQHLDGSVRSDRVGHGNYVLDRSNVLRFASAALRDQHLATLRALGVAFAVAPPQTDVLAEVRAERAAQDHKWGEQNHPDHPHTGPSADAWAALVTLLESEARASLHRGPTWAAILLEEVGEALQEDDPARLRAELVQVAAVAVAWVEAIDRRGGAQ